MPRAVLVLAGIVIAAFAPLLLNSFTNWDDPEFLLTNEHIRTLGISLVAWAFTTMRVGMYSPLAWLLAALEYAAWGLDHPWGYHLVSILLHAANAVALYRLTVQVLTLVKGDAAAFSAEETRRAAALAVALYAVHPLRVEVVAWVTVQHYLLSALFAILSISSYLRARGGGQPAGLAGLTVPFLLFAASLFSGPATTPLPVVLLILDVYPLRRVRWSRPRTNLAIVAEKIPFFILSFAIMAAAILAKKSLVALEGAGLSARVAQACYGIGFYPTKTLVPLGITAFYPLPARIGVTEPMFAIATAVTVLALLAVLALSRRLPGLAAATLIYLVIVAPHLGLVRVGLVLVADRYSYVATMAFVPPLAFGLARLIASCGHRRLVVTRLGPAIVAVLMALTWMQCGVWRTPDSMWVHALKYAPGNLEIRERLGMALAAQGKFREAKKEFAAIVRDAPDRTAVRMKLGLALDALGDPSAARDAFAGAVDREPRSFEVRAGFGKLLLGQRRVEEALEQYDEARRIAPEQAPSDLNLGIALARAGFPEQAESALRRSLARGPDSVAENELGIVLDARGMPDEADLHYREAVRLDPKFADALNNLGSSLARRRLYPEAIRQFERAIASRPDFALAHANLALALARVDRPEEAMSRLREALRLDPKLPGADRYLDQIRRAPLPRRTPGR